MSDRLWMYTGHPSQREMTTEWLNKTVEFLETTFSKGHPQTWCPCTKCKNYTRQTQDEMVKHLQIQGFMPGYTLRTFYGESAQRTREEVLRWCTDYYCIEDMVNDFDDAHHEDEENEESEKAFNAMLESSKRPLHGHNELC